MIKQSPIRIVLVDDHINIHKIIVRILADAPEIQLVGQGADGFEAIELCEQLKPDVVLMDVLMPKMDGISAMRELYTKNPQIKVLALSSFQDHESVHAMLKSGATGYISKSALSEDLIETIRATYHGKKVFSAEAFSHLVISPSPVNQNFNLTSREMEVLAMMAKGLNAPEMAEKLEISQSTVKFHVGNICEKLDVQTRSEALVVATRNKLV